MARREVRDCDRCGAREVEAVEVCLCVDRTMGGAGSMENDYEYADLCVRCAAWAFGQLKSRVKLSFEDARWLYDRIKAKP